MLFRILFFLGICISATHAQPELLLQLNHHDPILALDFSPDGRQLLTAGYFNQVLAWDFRTGKVIRPYYGITGNANCASYSPDGRLIAVGDTEGNLIIWEVATGKQTFAQKITVGDYDEPYIESVAFGKQGRYLAFAAEEYLCLLDLRKGKVTKEKNLDDYIEQMALTPDGRHLLCGGTYDGLYSFEFPSLKETSRKRPHGKDMEITSLAISRDGRLAATMSGSEYSIRIMRFDNGQLRRPKKLGPVSDELGYTTNSILCFSPDARYLYQGDWGKVLVWDVEKKRLIDSIKYSDEIPMVMDITPDGQFIASAGNGYFKVSDEDQDEDIVRYSIKLWDVLNRAFVKELMAANPIQYDDYAPYYDGYFGFFPQLSLLAFNNGMTLDLRNGAVAPFTEAQKKVIEDLVFPDTGQEEALIREAEHKELDSIYMVKYTTDSTRIAYVAVKDSLFSLKYLDLQAGTTHLVSRVSPYFYLDQNYSANLDYLVKDNTLYKLTEDSPSFSVADSMPFSYGMKLINFPGNDSTYLASDAEQNRLHFINLTSKDTVFSLQGANDNFSDFLLDGQFPPRRGISEHENGLFKLWDLQTGEELLSMALFHPGGFIFFTPEGYYYSSRSMPEVAAFLNNGAVYPFEQFDLRLNRPDIILKILGAEPALVKAYEKAYLKRLRKMGGGLAMLTDSIHVPEIQINPDSFPFVTSQPRLTAAVHAWDKESKLQRLYIYVNDIPVHGSGGISLERLNTKAYRGEHEIELSPGENKIQFSVLNQAGAESFKETFYVTCDAPTHSPNLHVITLGVSSFANPAMNLAYPAKDAADMANLFRSDTTTYGEVIIEDHYNQAVTPALLQQIKDKLMQTQVDDCVILYVAGHGVVDENLDYFLATYDTDFRYPAENSISYDELEALLDGIPARQKLFLLDACHSGEIDKESVELIREQQTTDGTVQFRSFDTRVVSTRLGLNNSFQLMKQLFVDLRRGTGATVISSASGVEFAMEGDQWQNGVFTYCLLKGLGQRAADADEDGRVMVSELQRYLAAEVPKLTEGRQQPTFRMENISNDWRVW